MKTIFQTKINDNFKLNGIVKFYQNEKPFFGLGFHYNNTKENKPDVVYSLFLDNIGSLKGDINMRFKNHDLVFGFNVLNNFPIPYLNFVLNND